jgi:beta-glucosidase
MGSGDACDHYRRFRQDFDLARALGHNCHRLSIEWSRIEPREGIYSHEAIQHYRDVLEALRDRGIEPLVTLHHFTLPQWLARDGGWQNPRTIAHFSRYTALIVRAYGDLVRRWITINEPVAYVYKSYIAGEWPPGIRDYGAAGRVLRNLLHAHVAAYQELHARQPEAQVSVAQHAMAFTPCNPRSHLDRFSASARGYLFNHLFVDALHRGVARVPGLLWEKLPRTRTLDFLGVNYYTRDFVHNTGLNLPGIVGGACGRDHGHLMGKRNRLGWEVYPEGLGTMMEEYHRYRLPILITENGIAATSDADRWAFIYLHLWQTVRAIGSGVPVIGYVYWSLIDNFEWAEGFAPRFGLVEVDYSTQERRVRPSARMFQAVIKRGQL